jgi:hypothetical protein
MSISYTIFSSWLVRVNFFNFICRYFFSASQNCSSGKILILSFYFSIYTIIFSISFSSNLIISLKLSCLRSERDSIPLSSRNSVKIFLSRNSSLSDCCCYLASLFYEKFLLQHFLDFISSFSITGSGPARMIE